MGDAEAAATTLRLVTPCDDLARTSLAGLQHDDAPHVPPRKQLAAYAALAQYGEALAFEPRFFEMLWQIVDFAVGSDAELHQSAWTTLKQLLPLLPTRSSQNKIAQRICTVLSRDLRDSDVLDSVVAVRVAESWAAAVRELDGVLVGRGSSAIQPLLDVQKRLLEHTVPAVRAAAHRSWKLLIDSWFAAGDLAAPRRAKRLKLLLSPLVSRSSRNGIFRSRALTEPDEDVRRAMVDSWLHLCSRVIDAATDPPDAATVLLGTGSAQDGSLHWDALLPHLAQTNDQAVHSMLVGFAARLLGECPTGLACAESGQSPPSYASVWYRIVPGLSEALNCACDKWETKDRLSAALSRALQLLIGPLQSTAAIGLMSNSKAPLLRRLQQLCNTAASLQQQVVDGNDLPVDDEKPCAFESCTTNSHSSKRRKVVQFERQVAGTTEEQKLKEGSREEKEKENTQAVRVMLGPNYVRQASSSVAGCFFAARANAPSEEAYWIHHAHISASQMNDKVDRNGSPVTTITEHVDMHGDDEATEQMSSSTGTRASPTECSQDSSGDRNDVEDTRDSPVNGTLPPTKEQQSLEPRTAGFSITREDDERVQQQSQEKTQSNKNTDSQHLECRLDEWLREGRKLLASLQQLGAPEGAHAQAVRVATAAVGALLATSGT